jgi:DNA invertase Pin-like site-specific DNA recombinase
MHRAIILARVSTRDQLYGHSIPTQLEACRTYAAQIGVPVVAEVVDSESGATLQREGLDEVRRRLTLGEADTLIVHTTSRLTRDPADLFTVRTRRRRLDS